jgi:CRISPR/Cas system-associated endoribonuclease Cas2
LTATFGKSSGWIPKLRWRAERRRKAWCAETLVQNDCNVRASFLSGEINPVNSASLQIPKSLKEIARPERCALVVYDMQRQLRTQINPGKKLAVI